MNAALSLRNQMSRVSLKMLQVSPPALLLLEPIILKVHELCIKYHVAPPPNASHPCHGRRETATLARFVLAVFSAATAGWVDMTTDRGGLKAL